MNSPRKILWLLGLASLLFETLALQPALAQPAPVPRAVVPAAEAPEAMAALFTPLVGGEQTIAIPGAAWLQLQLSEVQLAPDGVLTITSASGDSQSFSQAVIEAWGGLTAIFNGSEVRVTLTPGPGATAPVSAQVDTIIIGLPVLGDGGTEAVVPKPLRNLLGDIDRFIPDDVRPSPTFICGPSDKRVASSDPRVGRIMPAGCTGWLIDSGVILTAGHCANSEAQTVEFNVPGSQANGATVSPPVRDQYRITSWLSLYTGVGNDWAVFRVLPNTQTGLMPAVAQGATFQVSNTANPAQIRITGYGVDGPAPNFGDPGPRNAQSQTQQTRSGALSENTGGPYLGTLGHNADIKGGDSGSPVIVEGGNVTIGIHTHGACTAAGGTNYGTSFRNAFLWAFVTNTYTYSRNADLVGLNGGTIWVTTDRVHWTHVPTHVPGVLQSLVVGDFNGDGQTDLAGLNGGTILVTTDRVHWTNVPGVLQSFVVGDFNGDGKTDLAGLNGGTILVTTDLVHWTNVPGVLQSLVVGDFDGDGRADLAGLNSGTIWVTTDRVHWTNVPGVLQSLVVGDFDGDGRADLAGLNSGTIWVTTDRVHWTNVPGVLQSLVVGDFDGDGQTDLAGLNSGTIWVTTDLVHWTNVPGALQSLVVGDFDGDGQTDLAGLNSGTIWVTTDLVHWTNVPGVLQSLVVGQFGP